MRARRRACLAAFSASRSSPSASNAAAKLSGGAGSSGNSGWQRDLAISYGKVATAYLQLKQEAKAREALTAGQGILAQLTAEHPDWPQLQKDLDWFNKNIAELKD